MEEFEWAIAHSDFGGPNGGRIRPWQTRCRRYKNPHFSQTTREVGILFLLDLILAGFFWLEVAGVLDFIQVQTSWGELGDLPTAGGAKGDIE